jgi:hypothetical protein
MANEYGRPRKRAFWISGKTGPFNPASMDDTALDLSDLELALCSGQIVTHFGATNDGVLVITDGLGHLKPGMTARLKTDVAVPVVSPNF